MFKKGYQYVDKCGQMDKWTNGQMDKWTNGQMDICGQILTMVCFGNI